MPLLDRPVLLPLVESGQRFWTRTFLQQPPSPPPPGGGGGAAAIGAFVHVLHFDAPPSFAFLDVFAEPNGDFVAVAAALRAVVRGLHRCTDTHN